METSGVIAAHTHETKILHHSTNTSNVPIAILLSRGQRRNTATHCKYTETNRKFYLQMLWLLFPHPLSGSPFN